MTFRIETINYTTAAQQTTCETTWKHCSDSRLFSIPLVLYSSMSRHSKLDIIHNSSGDSMNLRQNPGDFVSLLFAHTNWLHWFSFDFALLFWWGNVIQNSASSWLFINSWLGWALFIIYVGSSSFIDRKPFLIFSKLIFFEENSKWNIFSFNRQTTSPTTMPELYIMDKLNDAYVR